ncbi:MAG: nuclease-related domain-containing protein [Limosilactobacillus pontis]
MLTSLNLPYAYHNGTENSNQIDCIVVNQKGIFVLEIKNYTADTIGIDQDGRL